MICLALLSVCLTLPASAAIRKGSTPGTYVVDQADLVRVLFLSNRPESDVAKFPTGPKAGTYVLTKAQLTDFVKISQVTPMPGAAKVSPTPKAAAPVPTKAPKPTEAPLVLPTASKGIVKGPKAGYYTVTKAWLTTIVGHANGLQAENKALTVALQRSRVSMDQMYAQLSVLSADRAEELKARDALIADYDRQLAALTQRAATLKAQRDSARTTGMVGAVLCGVGGYLAGK